MPCECWPALQLLARQQTLEVVLHLPVMQATTEYRHQVFVHPQVTADVEEGDCLGARGRLLPVCSDEHHLAVSGPPLGICLAVGDLQYFFLSRIQAPSTGS